LERTIEAVRLRAFQLGIPLPRSKMVRSRHIR
jgi:hypothetical protein